MVGPPLDDGHPALLGHRDLGLEPGDPGVGDTGEGAPAQPRPRPGNKGNVSTSPLTTPEKIFRTGHFYLKFPYFFSIFNQLIQMNFTFFGFGKKSTKQQTINSSVKSCACC